MADLLKQRALHPKAFCYIGDMKTVTYTRTAIKALRKIPRKDAEAVQDKMANYAAGGAEDVKALQGSDLFQLRHGNWRAIFSQDGAVIAVLEVAKRGEAYR
jgi:mRNA interferase RelE/StbE